MSPPATDFVVTPQGATLADQQSRIGGVLVELPLCTRTAP
jgi:hypothetical protein